MRKTLIILLHIGFWMCYFLLAGVIIGLMIERNVIDESRFDHYFNIIFAFVILPSFISFYSFYFFLFPRYVKKKKILLSITYGLIISIFAAIIGHIRFSTVTGKEYFTETTTKDDIDAITFIALITLINGIIAIVIQGFINWYSEIKQKDKLKQKNHEMEMALIKAQLDPHFLFNTINNIDVLIIKDADKASDYLNKLSDIMRFMLFETKSDEILLSQEIEYLEKYIELQKIRTNNLSYVSFEVKGNPKGNKIAPMVFIPFVENAFKHTNNKKIENAISISIIINDENIQLNCENKYDSSQKKQQKNGGLGNTLIRKRLDLIYPKRHTLDTYNQNNTYHIHLTILNEKI